MQKNCTSDKWKKKIKVTVTSKNLSDFLGKEHFNYLMANKKDEIGIPVGLPGHRWAAIHCRLKSMCPAG